MSTTSTRTLTHRPRTRPARARRGALGFTLVEMMVVVGIIALLIAIVVPAISQARTSAKVASTKATIGVMETGLDMYRTDSALGGSYPPSGPRVQQAISPHTGGDIYIGGANTLAWALVGADMQGTPGFQDLNGNGYWYDDTAGGASDDPEYRAENLYAVYPLNYAADASLAGKPAHKRYGPFVDVSKMSFPTLQGGGDEPFVLDGIEGASTENRLGTVCFLDAFGQPVLYYRANPAGVRMTDFNQFGGRGGVPVIYNEQDNAHITGSMDTSFLGMDFGAGPLGSDYGDCFHYLANVGEMPDGPSDTDHDCQPGGRKSFAHTIYDPNATIGTAAGIARPHRPDSYLLISAGPDGIYGSSDDVANFKVND